MAQDKLDQDFGIIKACAGDVWKFCKDVLPDVGRMKACMQSKMGQLPKPCLEKLVDAMAGSTFKVCKDQTYALCAAARCNVYDGVAYCQCEEKHGRQHQPAVSDGQGRGRVLGQRRRRRQQIHGEHL